MVSVGLLLADPASWSALEFGGVRMSGTKQGSMRRKQGCSTFGLLRCTARLTQEGVLFTTRTVKASLSQAAAAIMQMQILLCLLGAAWHGAAGTAGVEGAPAADLAWVVGIRRWVAWAPVRRAALRKMPGGQFCHPAPPRAAAPPPLPASRACRQLHAHPELSFQEEQTSRLIR